MKLLKNGFIVLLIAAALIFTFSCSKEEAAAGGEKEEAAESGEKEEKAMKPADVTFMASEADLPPDFVDSYNDTNEYGITLIRSEPDWTRFVAEAMAGTAADLLVLGSGSDLAYYVNRGLFKVLTPYFKESDMIKMDDIVQDANAEYHYDKETGNYGEGEWYGFSKDYNNIGAITYNKEIFDEEGVPYPPEQEPLTYQQVYEMAEKLTKKDANGNVVRWGTEFTAGWVRFLASDIAYMKGVSFFEDETRGKMNEDPAMRDVWKFFAKFFVEDLVPNVNNPAPGWTGSDFQSDRVAFVQLGYWFGAQMMNNEGYNEKYGWAVTPVWKKDGPRVTNTLGATGVVMYAKTDVPDQAFKVFEWYMAGEYGKERARTGWGIPPLRSLHDMLPKDNEFNKQRYDVAMTDEKYFKPCQYSPHIPSSAWDAAWLDNIDDLVKGNIDYDTFVDRYYEDMNEKLQTGLSEMGG